MICIKTDIPQEICDIDDELKAIYHSKDTVCIWVFKTREDRNRFMDETAGMLKDDREKYFESFYDQLSTEKLDENGDNCEGKFSTRLRIQFASQSNNFGILSMQLSELTGKRTELLTPCTTKTLRNKS